MPFKIWISGCTSNPNNNFGHWSKMTLKTFSYFLPKLQNQLTKMGTLLVKSSLDALQIEVFKNVNTKKFAKKLNSFNEKKNWKFLKLIKHFLLKLSPFFVTWFWILVRYIFDQGPKLSLGLDVRPGSPILKVI